MTDEEFVDAMVKIEELRIKYAVASDVCQSLQEATRKAEEARNQARDEYGMAAYLACGGDPKCHPRNAAARDRKCLIFQDGHVVELNVTVGSQLYPVSISRKRINIARQ